MNFKTGKIWIGLFLTSMLMAGCGLTAGTLLIGVLWQTPDVFVPASAIAGLPVIPLDAGFSFAFDGGIVVPHQSAGFVYLGTRPDLSFSDKSSTGISGATASLEQVDISDKLLLHDEGSGTYTLDPTDPKVGALTLAGGTFEFSAVQGTETYTTQVEKVPVSERVPEFHPSNGFVDLKVGDDLAFTRPEPAEGNERLIGFVTVFPVDISGQKGQPSYTNLPSDSLGYLKAAVAPNQWRQPRVVIPASAFPLPNKTYVVLFQTLKIGGAKTSNLFVASLGFVGEADVAVVKTRAE